jgi:pilus assembly protein CpaC
MTSNQPITQSTPAAAMPLPSGATAAEASSAAAAQLPPQIPSQAPGLRQPVMVSPFGNAPGRARLWRLPTVQPPLGMVPKPSDQTKKEFERFIGPITGDPANNLDLIVGRPRLVMVKDAPKRIQIADEHVATYTVMSPSEISIMGRSVGATVLSLWFTDPEDSSKQKVLTYLLRVMPDPEMKDWLERVYKALEGEINHAFPNSHIELRMVGDSMIVNGQARDTSEAGQIMHIVRSNVSDHSDVQPVDPEKPPAGYPAGGPYPPQPWEARRPGGINIINMLHIPGEQQVMLRVTVAEVDRAAARSIGLDFGIINRHGVTVFSNVTGAGGFGGLNGFGFGGFGFNNFNAGIGVGGIAANIGGLSGVHIPLAINALRTLNYARSLAEPNLVTLNGQTATFQAGGQFPVPVITGFAGGIGGVGGAGFVPYGVQLSFTPFITDKDRVRLSVQAEVSNLDAQGGALIAGSAVPLIDTRNFQTTVELREGQTLAVAGLIQNNLGADAERVPLFGDLPFFGMLASTNRIEHHEQELVVLITPELVHPMDPCEVPPLPGSDLFEPGDLEFYLLNRLESRRCYDYRSSVMTDICRMVKYRCCEQIYICGPHGHADGCDVPPSAHEDLIGVTPNVAQPAGPPPGPYAPPAGSPAQPLPPPRKAP